MGLFSFIKDAGEKLFSRGKAKETADKAAAAQTAEAQAAARAEADIAGAEAIVAYIEQQKLPVEGLVVKFDSAAGSVTVSGIAADQATREKVLLCCGNVAGVSAVNDMMAVKAAQPESQIHVVVRGDTLSAIAKKYYGSANKYMVIFEANKPMLNHPDKIYPGQALRIPPQ
jgi:nucleoid-associated protein YgaU